MFIVWWAGFFGNMLNDYFLGYSIVGNKETCIYKGQCKDIKCKECMNVVVIENKQPCQSGIIDNIAIIQLLLSFHLTWDVKSNVGRGNNPINSVIIWEEHLLIKFIKKGLFNLKGSKREIGVIKTSACPGLVLEISEWRAFITKAVFFTRDC